MKKHTRIPTARRRRLIYPPSSSTCDGGAEIRHSRCLKIDHDRTVAFIASYRDTPQKQTSGGRHHIGTPARFKSESVATSCSNVRPASSESAPKTSVCDVIIFI